jgi:hypothetical protein
MMNKENVMKVSRYAIYQLDFDHPKNRDLTFMEASEIEEISNEYDFVGIIDGKSLDDVFRISNTCGMFPELESLIERVMPMHSLSVGDIVHNLTTDETYVCASFGWTKIKMKESV